MPVIVLVQCDVQGCPSVAPVTLEQHDWGADHDPAGTLVVDGRDLSTEPAVWVDASVPLPAGWSVRPFMDKVECPAHAGVDLSAPTPICPTCAAAFPEGMVRLAPSGVCPQHGTVPSGVTINPAVPDVCDGCGRDLVVALHAPNCTWNAGP